VLSHWRRLFNGVGRSGGSSVVANLYVFSECFLRIDSPVKEEAESLAAPNLKERLLKLAEKDGKYEVLLDWVTNQFINKTLPGASAESEFDPKG